jgi:uncharacterized protein
MPLGAIQKLLAVVFPRIFTKPRNVLNLPTQKDYLLPTPAENTEEFSEPDSLSFTTSNEGENSLLVQSQEVRGDENEGLENLYISNLGTTVENTKTSLPEILVEKDMIKVSMLQDELQNFVSGSPEVQGAILASPDGLTLASVLPFGMDEERTAAMSASMLSLGERIGRELARGAVDRIVVEGEKGYSVLVGCSAEAVLLILATAAVKQGILFLEIKRAVAKITPMLA